MKVCGISAYFHDSAAAVAIDGRITAAAQEERFSRRKHDASLPVNAIRFCLQRSGIEAAELDAVVFYEKPFQKFFRILATNLANAPRSFKAFQGAMHSWFEKKLWIKGDIAKALGIPSDRIAFGDHHLSHAAAAFLTGPHRSAATLVVDGVGEWVSTTMGRLRRGAGGLEYERLASVDFPHSLGLFYSAMTAYLGFEVNEGEYKVMGLAPYGQPRYAERLRALIRHPEDALFELDLAYFEHDRSVIKGWSRKLEELLGPPRLPGRLAKREEADEGFQRLADVASSTQVVLEEELTRLVRRAKELTGEDVLVYAGGVALNSVANGKIARSGIFERLVIHPASGDAGGAIGAALAWGEAHGSPARHDGPFCPFTGSEVHEGGLPDLAQLAGARLLEDEPGFLRATAELLAADRIVGWMHGRAEWGPRSLGARSILARPDTPGQQARVNRLIKHRDSFRPFAPVVLDTHADQLFLDLTPDRGLERYMLSTVRTRPAWRERLAAVTHVDGSARVQVLRREDAPAFHRLLELVHERTGIPALLNTSFNLAGEPIVDSFRDGLRTFERTKLDALAAFPILCVKEDEALSRAASDDREARSTDVPA